VVTVVSSLAIAANAFAASMIQPVLQHQLALDTSVELGR